MPLFIYIYKYQKDKCKTSLIQPWYYFSFFFLYCHNNKKCWIKNDGRSKTIALQKQVLVCIWPYRAKGKKIVYLHWSVETLLKLEFLGL